VTQAGTVRALRNVAIGLAVLAPLAGSPARPSTGTTRPEIASELASVITRGEDRVAALALAEWIRDRMPGLRVVHVTPAGGRSDVDVVPTAAPLSLGALLRLPVGPDETLVLSSADATLAAQAWVLLRAAGHERTFVLAGGVDAWDRDVMSPTIARDASAEERRAFERVAAVSRYFGGLPHQGDRTTTFDVEDTDSRAQNAATPSTPARRRGCGG
jgi:hypothetical protein